MSTPLALKKIVYLSLIVLIVTQPLTGNETFKQSCEAINIHPDDVLSASTMIGTTWCASYFIQNHQLKRALQILPPLALATRIITTTQLWKEWFGSTAGFACYNETCEGICHECKMTHANLEHIVALESLLLWKKAAHKIFCLPKNQQPTFECILCYEDKRGAPPIKPCTCKIHYCGKCLQTWLDTFKNKTTQPCCPTCRKDLSSMKVTTNEQCSSCNIEL